MITKLDKTGKMQLDAEIETTKQQLQKIREIKGLAYTEDVNSWHDNAQYDIALVNEHDLESKLESLAETANNVLLISEKNNKEIVDINNNYIIKIVKPKEFAEIIKIKLTANYKLSNENKKLKEISINSPLGNAIYEKKVGENFCYIVENTAFEGIIIKA